MQIKIRGKLWKFLREELKEERGYCDSPVLKGKKIVVDSRLTGEEELSIITHEMVHAAMWDLDEECVTETADCIAKALWRIGYRKSENE